jgi:hypothetical protein
MEPLTDSENKDEKQMSASSQSNVVSFREGYNFVFEESGHLIRVHGSAVTGKESIYIDNKLVVEKRSFGRRSCLAFTLDGCSYEAEFYVANLLKGETHCSLIKEGVHVETLKKSLKKSRQVNTKSVIRLFLYGALVGFVMVTVMQKFLNE